MPVDTPQADTQETATKNESGSNTEEPNLSYQGRKTSRVKSEQRRRLILEASLRIVIREGVRGIRHRAVAKEAGVPLAATTYYFKDIQELIVDTFTLYTEKALDVVQQFAEQFYQPLKKLSGQNGMLLSAGKTISEDAQAAIVGYIANQLTEYIRTQIVNGRHMLIAEQAFRYEAIVNDQIREMALLHRRTLFEKIESFMQLIESKYPKEDAELILGLFHSLEYTGLLAGESQADLDVVHKILHRQISLLLPSLLAGR